MKNITFISTHSLRAIIFALLFVLFLSTTSFAQGGGCSFTQTIVEDTLIRNSVGNLFKLIEGAAGALVMVIFGVASIVAALLKRFRLALLLFSGAALTFGVRCLVSLFFGTEFQDYEV